MKQVGIITITGLGNYGNRLQNYALQYAVEKYTGACCETLINKSSRLKGYIKAVLFPRRGSLSKRELIFQNFNEEFVHFSDIKINNIVKNKKLKKYDCLICGSDQIWNSDYPENDKANFGHFFPEQKVISYAASFGTNIVKNSKKKKYAQYLKSLYSISVREEQGKLLAEELSGRKDVYVHIDPTFLLSSEEWSKIEKKPEQYTGGKYILKYFLGGKNSELNQEIENLAREKKFEIIDVISPDSPYYNIGPLEFLYLEHHAELIVTDSFHSCVFALIFGCAFIVADRKESSLQSMGSRIDTLLNLFDLNNRRFGADKFNDLLLNEIDFFQIQEIIKKEKENSIQYLLQNI